MSKHLKSYQDYLDRYDRCTVEHCRATEKSLNEQEEPSAEGEEFTPEDADRMKKSVAKFYLHLVAGERYLNKDKVIREWMECDQKRDELYESAVAPEGIRCLTCRSLVKPTYKELCSSLGKSDRILFMYDCPNSCLPRRAFFSDGEEFRCKPNLCPRCDISLTPQQTSTEKKLITTFTCSRCQYSISEEYRWTHTQEDKPDEHFAADRDRFCLTDAEGEKYRREKYDWERMGKFMKEWDEKEKARAEKLKANPQGFHLEGAGYTCFICGDRTPEGDNWYDQYGIKCLVCQKAVDEGEIPPTLAKDKESWYSKYDLQSRFNLKGPTLTAWVKKGVIKARTISRYGKGTHAQVFLIEDNKNFLPPKNLTESQFVREMKDGEQRQRLDPWYKLVDPKEHLKGYRIVEYLKITMEEESKKPKNDSV